MATNIFYTNVTESGLVVSGRHIYKASLTRGSGVATLADASATGSVAITDDGSTPVGYAMQVNAYSATTGTYTMNHWGLESNAMANFTAGVGAVRVYDSGGTLRFSLVSVSGWGSAVEYGVASAVKTGTNAGTAQTINSGDWIEIEPWHIAAGTAAAGFTLTFSYNGTTGAADGDSFITFPDTVTAFTAAGNPPYTNVYPPFLAQ